jgi:RHS repeat-associated protein
MSKKIFYRVVLLSIGLLSFLIHGFSQVSFVGPLKINAGSSACYSATSSCNTTGYCWSVSAGSIDNTNCGGIIIEMSPNTQSSTVSPDIIQPPPGGCSQPAGVTVNFNYYSTLTTVTVTVLDNCGSTQTKSVTVVPALNAISASPSSQTISCNATPAALTCSSPSGGDGTYNYQWQSSTDNSNWSNISGASASTYVPTGYPSIGTIYYRVIVTSFDYTQYSNSCVLTTTGAPALSGGAISNPTQAINYNSIPSTLSCTAATGGSCSPITYLYQWQTSLNGSTWNNIAGATSQNYSPGALTITTYYRRQTTYSSNTAYSNTATITVYPALVAGSETPLTQTINYNSNGSLLTLSGVSGGSGSYTYQWQSGANSSVFTDIAGATSTTFTPLSLTSTTYYRVRVTSNSQSVYTDPATVFVNPQLLPGTISPNYITITSGSSPGGLTGTSAYYGSCSGNYSYQWLSSTNGTTFNNISGATSQNYVPGNLTVHTWYTRMVSCAGVTAYSDTIQVVINSGTPDVSYIRIRDIMKPSVLDSASAKALTSPYDVSQTTQYFDGLGRPIETVAMQQSPLQKDLVSFNVYDAIGREASKYLSYVSTTNNGQYNPTPFPDEYNFNTTQYPGEQDYYSQSVYEPSPLNRVITSYAAGNSWVGSGRGINMQYQVNTVADSVRCWKIAFASGSLPTTSGAYATGTIYKNITTDEAGHSVVEYKDMEGKVVLKKVQLANSPGTAHVGWLCTYYIYDDLNNLRFVIQPAGVQLINANWTLTTTIANELCFRYEYDYRKRMIIKKIPGAGETWMVYDLRDRLVMSQDSSLRLLHKWMYVRYDDQNRPDSTGLLTDPTNYNNLGYHQNLASNSTTYPNLASYTTELLTQTYYDDYNWVSTSGSGLSSSMATNYTSNSSYFNTSYSVTPYSQPLTQFNITRGMPTGTKTKVIGTASQYLYAVNFYDDRGRIIQTQSVNYTGAIDTSIVQYTFNGKPLRTLLLHRKNGINTQNHKILTKMAYDAGNRLLTVYKNIDNAGTDQLVVTNTYNELGQLSNKQLGNNLENLAYTYNVRGWLTSINKNYIAGTASNYFGMELGYDKTASAAGTTSYLTPQYNGNIEGTVWKSKGDGINRKYDFTYDNVNRLTAANFVQNTTGSTWDHSYLDFTANNLQYDANGNIMTMNQYGFKINGSGLIDQLTYSYQANSNKLNKVVDNVNVADSKLGDFHYTSKGTNDYAYDGNGNLVSDANKAISGISYNYLNLPSLVTVTNKGTITYTYDAAGNKLAKTTVDNTISKTTTTKYINGIVYQNDTLQFIPQEEGRARWAFHKYTNGTSGYGFEYDYFLKDHLGNVRMVLSQEKDTAKYIATMESAYRATENQLFYNIPQSSYARSAVSGYPTDNTTVPNDSLARVNGNGPKVGPSILLRVMSGDVIDIATKSFYKSGGTVQSPNSIFSDVLNSLASGIVTATSATHGVVTDLTNPVSSPIYSALNSFLPTNDPNTVGKPKAYLNWILLDDQFKGINTYPQSGAIPVGSADVLNTLAYSGIPITKNGYLYIWVSNETPGWDVFFDNLSIQQRNGPITEETHYYPFGLTMAGISSKAAGGIQNRYKFNAGTELQSGEFSDGGGLELYATNYRSLDPQIGRFWQIDPMDGLTQNTSLYAYGGNNPISFNDPLGLWKDSIKTSKGEIAYANNPTLATVVVSLPKKQQKSEQASWFYWPNDINPKNIKIWDRDKILAIRRLENGLPLVQGGESDNYLKKLDWYKQIYQSDQDYRIMSMASVLILASPVLVEAMPELATELKSLAETDAVRDVSNINEIREKVSQIIVRILSKYKLAPYSVMKSILNSGKEWKSAAELFESAQKIYENYEHLRQFFGF